MTRHALYQAALIRQVLLRNRKGARARSACFSPYEERCKGSGPLLTWRLSIELIQASAGAAAAELLTHVQVSGILDTNPGKKGALTAHTSTA
jgi:hypothetical protein